MNEHALVYVISGLFFSLFFQFLAVYLAEKFIASQENIDYGLKIHRYTHAGWDIMPFIVTYFIILPLYPIFAVAGYSVMTMFFYCLFYGFLTLFTVLDVERHWLPQRFTLAFIICGGIYGYVAQPEHIVQLMMSAGVLWLVFWSFRAVAMRRNGDETFGLGDVYLIAGLTLWLSWLTTLYVMIIAASMAITFLWIKRYWFRSVARGVPFGPFLCAVAAIVAILPISR
jgi:prepilin signal peptidase PulO-like enzyme (type II secretory pathway)